MHNFQMNINEYLPLRDVVFYTLRQAILKGELEPGERLMEMQLAEQLGVSRTPIREAIRKLELEGLVLMIPRRGAIVAKITEKDLKDVLEVRASLERLSTKLACERMEEETIEELREAQEAFKAALRGDDITLQAQKDVEFHTYIARCSKNKVIEKLVPIIQSAVITFVNLTHRQLKDETIDTHRAITDAILNGDSAGAKYAMIMHLNYNRQMILKKQAKAQQKNE